ncbi:MAG: LamG-like jellyroll fold domain-containing protein, partial [Verrucomicrobiaceae bacterium]
MGKSSILLHCVQAGFLLLGAISLSAGGASDDIKNLTGSRTRIVWSQDTGGGKDPNAEGSKLRLMGLDTEDGGEERPVLAKVSNYYRPLITRKGDRVVFTNYVEHKVYVVNWDGSGLRLLTSGIAEAVWRNPKDEIEWVYVRNAPDNRGQPQSGKNVDRYQISHPEIKEQVWHNETYPMEDFQLSADGLRAAGSFPWPVGGLAEIPSGGLTRLGDGCWPSMSPDNSYRCWIFEGSHRAVRMYEPGVKNSWKVVINNLPELRKNEVYHPRWSNDPRIICMTGPYGRQIKRGGTGVEIYLGRFEPEFHAIEKWVQVTRNDRGDFFPDVWIESASRREDAKAVLVEKSDQARPDPATFLEKLFGLRGKQNESGKSPGRTSDENQKWPGTNDGWVFIWENGASQGMIQDPKTHARMPAITQPRGLAVYGRNREMDLNNGSFVARDADSALLNALQVSNQISIEVVIVPERKKLRKPAEIITFSSTAKSRNFSLTQDDSWLTFRIRTSLTGPNASKPVFKLCELKEGMAQHVIVTYQRGRIVCYLDGGKVFDEHCSEGDFSSWTEQHLVFGDEWREGTADWPGRLEGVAIFNRVLSSDEASDHHKLFQQKLKERKPVEQIVVKARLLSVTPPPAPASIAPYRRALVVNDYEVEQVRAGSFVDKKLQAAHWGVLDGKVLPQDWESGSVYELTLEKFSDQPQLEGERLVSDSEDFDLTLFYTV